MSSRLRLNLRSYALAVRHPDPDFPTNKFRMGRDPVAKHDCTSTASAGGKADRRYRTTSCSVPRGCELEEDRANA